MNILLLLFYLFMFKFSFIVLLLLRCHAWYRDACKSLHGLGICVWFYRNKLMMIIVIIIITIIINSIITIVAWPFKLIHQENMKIILKIQIAVAMLSNFNIELSYSSVIIST